MVFKNSNTHLLHITTHLPKQIEKKIKHWPKTSGSLPVLSWNPTIFWSFSKYPKPAIIWIGFFFKYLELAVLWFWNFSNTQNQQVLQKSNTHPALVVFGSDTCNAVNGLLLSHQTHSKFTPLSASSICTWMELLASVTQHPRTNGWSEPAATNAPVEDEPIQPVLRMNISLPIEIFFFTSSLPRNSLPTTYQPHPPSLHH